MEIQARANKVNVSDPNDDFIVIDTSIEQLTPSEEKEQGIVVVVVVVVVPEWCHPYGAVACQRH